MIELFSDITPKYAFVHVQELADGKGQQRISDNYVLVNIGMSLVYLRHVILDRMESPWPDFEGYLRDMDLELGVEVIEVRGHGNVS
jgi:hypothetical protein